jgi:hypothetical protein
LKISTKTTNIRTIRQGDAKFMLQDGLMICPRAGFEISEKCPTNYAKVLAECIEYGWLKPVAHVYGKELTMDALR